MNNLIFVGIGLVAGVLAGMFGIGGGIIVVPALILAAKYSPQLATGTSLAVFLFPVGLFGAYAYYKEGNVRMIAATLLALGVLIGSYFGARIAQQMSPLMLRRAFAILLVATAVRMWWGKA
jgi:uncharacterized protein